MLIFVPLKQASGKVDQSVSATAVDNIDDDGKSATPDDRI